MTVVWRLLEHGDAPGPWNMGVDEALLESAVASGEPALRFYGWDGAWLSLGYAQADLSPERHRACRRADVGVVWRATGGRAVLHGGDLTYAVAAPAHRLPAGLRATYALICDALVEALGELGVAGERMAGPAGADSLPEFDCFAQAASDEICAGGRKLVGSAQRRQTGGVLQHGSIRLWADPEHVRGIVGGPGGSATSCAELGAEISPAQLAEACSRALAEALGASLVRSELTEHEARFAAARAQRPELRGQKLVS